MGFKQSSGIIAVSGRIEESAPGTFTETEINLSLDPLNNEIFVVLAIDSALSMPNFIPGTDTTALFQLSTTTQAAISGLENPNVMVRTERRIQSPAAGDTVYSEQLAGESPQATLDYIQIVATPDLFAQIEGLNTTSQMACAYRVWGYRAKADAATYAALVQSEVLSN
tara:strand:+ start:422 stop:925 length:504 start_codon:yes stop_codon:yes gene_type:complete